MATGAGAGGSAAWAVLVYMAGDNNLTEEMAWGLQELKKTSARIEADRKARARGGEAPHPLEGRISVVAHFDPRGSRSRRYDFVPPSDIVSGDEDASADGNLQAYEAMIYTRGNGGPRSARNPLASFVAEQVQRLEKAERYFLILSGHGSGAVGDFLNDSDPQTSLSIPELARILDVALDTYANTKADPPGAWRRIDIVGMDSCLMSTAEVCVEIRDYADYLVGSEGWVANAGWPYHRVLEACLDEKGRASSDAERVARRVAENYSSFYRDYEIAGISTDIAVSSLEEFRKEGPDSLIGLLRELAVSFREAFDTVYVGNVLSTSKKGSAADPVKHLAGQVAHLLHPEHSGPRAKLSRALRRGSAGARARLAGPARLAELSESEREAVRGLWELKTRRFGLPDEEVWAALATAREWKNVVAALTKPASLSEALAVVRLQRECDPGIQAALVEIERQELAGRAKAKQARATLQKLHQVQSILDLRALAGKRQLARILAQPRHRQLLNAVVAARWQAQSFKGGVYVDLKDFCECLSHLAAEARIRELCDRIGHAARVAVTTEEKTGAATQHANGLSVYFPSQAADYAPEYENLQFAKRTGWGLLVSTYLRATRRERYLEPEAWAEPNDRVQRFGRSEVDPLESAGIEARIVGVVSPEESTDLDAVIDAEISELIRAGIAEKVRAGISEKVRGGVAARVWREVERMVKDAMTPTGQPGALWRSGIEEKVRAGIEQKVRAAVEAESGKVQEKVLDEIRARIEAGGVPRIRAAVEAKVRTGTRKDGRAASVHVPDPSPTPELQEDDYQRIWEGVKKQIRRSLTRLMLGAAPDASAMAEEAFRTGIQEMVRAGIEEKVRSGIAEKVRSGIAEKVRSGIEEKVRSGIAEKVRTGTEAKIRGEGTLFEWGNGPDGFHRSAGNGKAPLGARPAKPAKPAAPQSVGEKHARQERLA
jgi:hypothetical protein